MKGFRLLIFISFIACKSDTDKIVVRSINDIIYDIGVSISDYEEIIIITPTQSCNSCNMELLKYFKENDSKRILLIVSSTPKEANLLVKNYTSVKSSNHVLIDSNLELLGIYGLKFPSILKKSEDDSFSYSEITPGNINSLLDKTII